jgi:hypothetical protein
MTPVLSTNEFGKPGTPGSEPTFENVHPTDPL